MTTGAATVSSYVTPPKNFNHPLVANSTVLGITGGGMEAAVPEVSSDTQAIYRSDTGSGASWSQDETHSCVGGGACNVLDATVALNGQDYFGWTWSTGSQINYKVFSWDKSMSTSTDGIFANEYVNRSSTAGKKDWLHATAVSGGDIYYSNSTMESSPTLYQQGVVRTGSYQQASVAVNGTNNVLVASRDASGGVYLVRRLGGQWTEQTLATNAENDPVSIAVTRPDSEPWVAYTDTSNDLWVVNSSANEQEVLTGTVEDPALATNNGSRLYAVYHNTTNDDIEMMKSGEGCGWTGPITLQSGTYSDPSTKFQYFHNHGADQRIDYMFADGSNVLYANKTLQESCPPRWREQGQNTSSISPGDTVKLYAQGRDAINLSHAELATNESGVWENKSGVYSSPQRFRTKDTWEWSNFTWQNGSVSGTTVGWKVWYNDTAGNHNVTDVVEFKVGSGGGDTTPPTVTIHDPPNATLADDTPWLNVTADETVDTWKYNVDDQANTTFSPNVTLSALADGQHNVTVWANDSSDNWGKEIRYFRVDANAPEWREQGQNTSSIRAGKTVKLYAQGRDTINLSHATLATNETGAFANKSVYSSPQRFFSANTWEWSNFTWHNDSVAGTTVGWKVWYNDTAGNWNVTDITTFTVGAQVERLVAQTVSVSETSPRAYSGGKEFVQQVQTSSLPVRGSTAGRILAEAVSFDKVFPRQAFTGRTVTDIVSLQGVVDRLAVYDRLETDAIAVGETLDLSRGLGRLRSQAVSVDAGVGRLFSGGRSINDGYSVTDQIDRLYAGSRTVTGTFDIVDQAVERVALFTTVSEAYGYTAEATRGFVGQRGIDETITVFDTATRTGILSRTLSTTYTVVDDATTSVSIGKVVEEVFQASDTGLRGFDGFRTVGGAIGIQVSETRQAFVSRLRAVGLSVVDSPVQEVVTVRVLTESIGYNRVVTEVRDTGRSVVEAVSFLSTDDRTMAAGRVVVDTVSVDEAVDRLVIGARSIGEGIGVSSATDRLQTSLRDVAGSIAFSSTIDRSFTGIREVQETISVTTTPIRSFIGSRVLEDAIGISDEVSDRLSAFEVVSESYSYVSDVSRTFITERLVERTFSLDDDVRRGTVVARVVDEVYGVVDVVSGTKVVNQLIDETFTFADTTSRGFQGLRETGQSILVGMDDARQVVGSRLTTIGVGLTDNPIRELSSFRTIVDGFDYSAVASRTSGIGRSIDQGVDFLSTAGRVTVVDRLVERTIATGVVVSRTGEMTRELVEDLSVDTGVVDVVSAVEQIGQSFSVDTAVDRSSVTLRTTVEHLSVDVVQLRDAFLDRVVSQLVGYDDQIAFDPTVFKAVTQSVNVQDTVGRGFSGFRSVGETFGAVVEGLRSGSLARTVSDGYGYGSVVDAAREVTKQLGQLYGITVDVDRDTLLDRVQAMDVGVLGERERFVDVVRILDQAVSFDGPVERVRDSFRTLEDTFAVTGVASTVGASFRDVSGSIDVLDAVSRTGGLERAARTVLDVSAGVGREIDGFRTVMVDVGTDMTVTFTDVISRKVTETFGVGTGFDRIVDSGRSFGESLGVDAAAGRLVAVSRGQMFQVGLVSGQVTNVWKTLDESITLQAPVTRSVAVGRVIGEDWSWSGLLDLIFPADEETDGGTDDGGDDGGGGGGGGIGGLPPEDPGLRVDTERIVLKMRPGERSEFGIDLANNGSANGTYNLEAEGLDSMIWPRRTAHVLTPDETATSRFEVNVSADTGPGLYEGGVSVGMEDRSETVPVDIIVEIPEDERLESRLSIEESDTGDIQALIDLYNLGRNRSLETNVTMTVRGANGTVVRRWNRVLDIGTARQVLSSVGEDLPPGNYSMEAQFAYGNVTQTKRSSFSVTESEAEEARETRTGMDDPGIEVLLLMLVIGVAAVLLHAGRRRLPVLGIRERLAGLRPDLSEMKPDTPYRCPECGSSFSTRSMLRIHTNKHGIEDSLKIGAAASTVRTELKNLMSREEKTCPECGERFTSRTSYRIHRNQHRAAEVLGLSAADMDESGSIEEGDEEAETVSVDLEADHVCDSCGEEFFTQKELEIHREREH